MAGEGLHVSEVGERVPCARDLLPRPGRRLEMDG